MAAEFGISTGRWEQYRDLGEVPFDAMWVTVPAGGRSNLDQHPERELVIVLDGTPVFESGGERHEVAAGSAVLTDSREPHVIHNPGDRPATMLSVYWMPAGEGDNAG